jgi:putative transposase
MGKMESLNHTKWDCKYHVVHIPKNRPKVLYAELRKYLGEVFRSLAQQKGCRIEEGHLMVDHIRTLNCETRACANFTSGRARREPAHSQN